MQPVPFLTLVVIWLLGAAMLTNPDPLESLIEEAVAKEHRLFVAIGSEDDFRGPFKRLTDNFRSVLEDKADPTLRFLVHIGPIPPSLADRCFLHYHTLPKIKMFWRGGHLTYYGGTSPAHIRAWVAKQLRGA